MALPAWLATTEHEPVASSVILAPRVPPDVHTADVVVVKDTARPDEAVALTVRGESARVLAPGLMNVIVWAARETVNVTVFWAAAK